MILSDGFTSDPIPNARMLASALNAGTTSGTSTAYTATLPGVSSLVDGMLFEVKWHTAGGASPTLSINGMSAKALVTEFGRFAATFSGQRDLLRYDAGSDKFVVIGRGNAWVNPYTYLHNLKMLQFQNLNQGATTWDVGTVPTGKKWLVTGLWTSNANGSIIVFTLKFKRNGTYYQAFQPTNSSANTVGGTTQPQFPVLVAGDILAATTATSGLDLHFTVWEIDDTSPVKSNCVFDLAGGNNTIYTCPAGYNAFGFSVVTGQPLVGMLTTSFVYSNTSAGSKNIYGNLVKSGGSPAAPGVGSNALRPAATSVNNTLTVLVQTNTMPGCLNPGDYLNLNTSASGSGQHAWATVLEVPA